jgi:DNA-binding YbaB/EbfC family protein
MVIEGQSGAGMVRVSLTGGGVLKSVVIDPKLADPTETEMLQDLIVAAHADAKRKVDAAMQAEMAQMTGGLQLPPGMKLPF